MGWNKGWWSGAQFVPSPNFDGRPSQVEVNLLVLHNISLPPGQFGTGAVAQFFLNKLDVSAHPYFVEIEKLTVSAHFLIERDGQIIQFVSCDERAWHAGASEFFGRSRCNDFSIGIELEGVDDAPFSDIQYNALVLLIHKLCERYPITAIAGHSDIAPGRKTDPGPCFDWKRVVCQSGFTEGMFPYGLDAR